MIDFSKHRKEVFFIPLGGSGEIGMNCNLYHCDGKWLIVDLGIGFVNDLPGIKVSLPDITFIKQNKKNFLGIVVTHIHEDHIGAIQYLWNQLELPIYTTKLGSLFLRDRMQNLPYANRVKIHEVKRGDRVRLDPFEMEFIGLTHSAPEMNGILIKTNRGNIFHTGDWKFDNEPIIGEQSDKRRLKELGDRGEVHAMVCESTNAFVNGETHTEAELLESFTEIFSKRKNLILCFTFASNIARLKIIHKAARKAGRHVGITGFSLVRMVRIAREAGYIPKEMEFLMDEDLNRYKRSEMVIISTGGQGEFGSGSDKIASGQHPYVHLRKNDTVIFSASVIPGNEVDVGQLHNKLSEKDVELITADSHLVHNSGHYTADDLREMYRLIRPKMAIAIHGEPIHLAEHKRIAEESGVVHAMKASDGAIIQIGENDLRVVDRLEIDPVYIDGTRFIVGKSILKERRKIMEAGVVSINLIVDTKSHKMLARPAIYAVGNYDLKKDKAMAEILEEDIADAYNKALNQIAGLDGKKSKNRDGELKTSEQQDEFLAQHVRSAINRIFMEDMGKKPVIGLTVTRMGR